MTAQGAVSCTVSPLETNAWRRITCVRAGLTLCVCVCGRWMVCVLVHSVMEGQKGQSLLEHSANPNPSGHFEDLGLILGLEFELGCGKLSCKDRGVFLGLVKESV